MSGFAVVVAGQRATAGWISATVSRVADALARRGGAAVPVDLGGVVLLQAGRATGARAGPLTVVGDLGLTDLRDLRGALGLGPDVAPAELVLAAWHRWGLEAAQHLHGDFACVIHDSRSGTVTAVRDRFGVRPLVWTTEHDRVIIAQDLDVAEAGRTTPSPIDRAWVADFLSGRATCPESTALEAIRRVPAGHRLVLSLGTAPRSQAWYRLDRQPPPAVASDHAEALHAALAHATREACAADPTATMLSGGLDSSSLALLSGDADPPVPRPALSLRYRDPTLDEGRHIEAVLARSGGTLHGIDLPGEVDAGQLFDLDAHLAEQGEPVFTPGLSGNRTLYRAARAAGCAAILDGHGGDEVIGGGLADARWTVDSAGWSAALRQATAYARFTGEPLREAVAVLLSWRGRRGFGRLGRRLGPAVPDPTAWRSLVDPDLAAETGLVDRVRAQLAAPTPDDLPPWVALHAAQLSAPTVAGGFDVLDRAARTAGITPRYPFYDHRVVELCIWQPGPERLTQGQPRSLLRRAMRGVLPEAVRLRADKTDFLRDFSAALRRDPAGRLAALRTGPGVLSGWVNGATLRRDLATLDGGTDDPQAVFRIWRALWLAAWLDSRRVAGGRRATTPAARGDAVAPGVCDAG